MLRRFDRRDYFDMKKLFPEPIETEQYRIRHVILDQTQVKREKIHHLFKGIYAEVYELEPKIMMIILDKIKPKNEVMMSDSPMEKRTNLEFLNHVNGKVLIAGLGIGLVILPIQEMKEVQAITVIEICPKLIDFIKPKLPLNGKVEIINADIFTWRPKNNGLFDTIYFDIWSEISGDNYGDTKVLHRIFSRYLNRENPNAQISSWRRNDFKRLAKSDSLSDFAERERELWRKIKKELEENPIC